MSSKGLLSHPDVSSAFPGYLPWEDPSPWAGSLPSPRAPRCRFAPSHLRASSVTLICPLHGLEISVCCCLPDEIPASAPTCVRGKVGSKGCAPSAALCPRDAECPL